MVARELAAGLAARGHDVTFLVADQRDGEFSDTKRDGIRTIRYPGAGQGLEFIHQGRRAAASLCVGNSFDIVHTHFAYAGVGPLRAIPAQTVRVRTFHGPWDAEGWVEDVAGSRSISKRAKGGLKWLFRHHVERRSLTCSRKIVVLSNYFREELTGRFGVPAERIATVPGGVDLQRFRPATNKADTRQRLDLPRDPFILLSVRRLAPRMGLDRLVQAMPAILERHPDTLLLIAGKGPERANLERLIGECQVTKNVRLLGFVSDADLPAYYQAADLFVLPTLALEGFGLVTVEALASGLPVIGTNVGATPEILAGLNERLIVRGDSAVELAERIIEFRSAAWSRSLTPDHLRSYVVNRYSWEAHVDQTETLYRDFLSNNSEHNG